MDSGVNGCRLLSARNLRRDLVVAPLVVAAALVLGACGGTAPQASAPDASQSTHAPGQTSSATPGDATDESIAVMEDRLYADAYADAGTTNLVGPAVVDAITDARNDLLTDTSGRVTGGLVAYVAAIDPLSGIDVPTVPVAVGADFRGNLWTLTTSVSQQVSGTSTGSSGSGGTTTSTVDTTITLRGQQVRVQGMTTTHISVAGSRITGSIQSDLTTTIRDASGEVVEIATESTLGTLEMDICPDANGRIRATYVLEITTASSAGASRNVLRGTVDVTVGDDAFVQSYTVDGAAERTATAPSGDSVIDRVVTSTSTYQLTGAPGDMGSATATSDPTISTRAESGASLESLVTMAVDAGSPGRYIASRVVERAQTEWRNGACVVIEATDRSRDVAPDEQIPFTATVKHKVDGSAIDKPIVAALQGDRSVSPVDTEVPSPADFTFIAGSEELDEGDVAMTSTSNRGVGTLTLRFIVKEPLQLELRIESNMEIAIYNTFAASTSINVKGTIRLDRDPVSGRWNGRGTLATFAISEEAGGCNSIEIVGTGQYDWDVRDVVADEGIATSDIVIHMDAGPISEQPDTFVARVCPAGTRTGALNTWENLFFLIHRDAFSTNGFRVDDLSPGSGDPTDWQPGQELGGITWLGSCDGFGQAPTSLVACEAETTFSLVVVDPSP